MKLLSSIGLIHRSLQKWTFLLALIVPSIFCEAQQIFSADYASQADVKVFVVEHASQADLLVFKVDYASQAKGNEGLWFFVGYASQADKKIFFVDYASQADLKIHFVAYASQVGWEEKSKQHLMY
ncbi:MAG: DUF6150 family protein [Flavobacteriales bacterium]